MSTMSNSPALSSKDDEEDAEEGLDVEHDVEEQSYDVQESTSNVSTAQKNRLSRARKKASSKEDILWKCSEVLPNVSKRRRISESPQPTVASNQVRIYVHVSFGSFLRQYCSIAFQLLDFWIPPPPPPPPV